MPVRLKDSPKSQRTRLQHAEWLGNTTSLIIITENDIYLRQSPADEEDLRLTHTGVPGLIYNGVADWLYQGEYQAVASASSWLTSSFLSTEEIFKSQKALWGSNDGTMLLYATFNDTNVGQVSRHVVLWEGSFANHIAPFRWCFRGSHPIPLYNLVSHPSLLILMCDATLMPSLLLLSRSILRWSYE